MILRSRHNIVYVNWKGVPHTMLTLALGRRYPAGTWFVVLEQSPEMWTVMDPTGQIVVSHGNMFTSRYERDGFKSETV